MTWTLRFRRLAGPATGAICSALPLLGCTMGPHTSVGKDRLWVVSFPEPWRGVDKRTHEPNAGIHGDYEVRRSPSIPGALLFGIDTPDSETSYSVQFYAVTLGKALTLQPVTAEEWAQAVALPKRSSDPLLTYVPPHPTIVKFGGKTFAGSTGARVFAAFPSPDETWIALISSPEVYKPNFLQRTGLRYLGGGGPSEGTFFLDIFEVASGRTVLSTRVRSSFVFHGAFWAGDEIFIVPVERTLQSCLIASLRAVG